MFVFISLLVRSLLRILLNSYFLFLFIIYIIYSFICVVLCYAAANDKSMTKMEKKKKKRESNVQWNSKYQYYVVMQYDFARPNSMLLLMLLLLLFVDKIETQTTFQSVEFLTKRKINPDENESKTKPIEVFFFFFCYVQNIQNECQSKLKSQE